MLFTSTVFFILLAVTLPLYYLVGGGRWQVGVLIVASLVFYAWNFPLLLLLLLSSIGINFAVSNGVVRAATPGRMRAWATGGVMVNLGILASFKYGPLAGRTFFPADSSIGDLLVSIPLPIGVSFFTFQGISLVVDLYRRQLAGEGPQGVVRLPQVALYLAFFPQLIAGPIVKAHDFLPQIGGKRLLDVPWAATFRTLTVGYFLKTFVADNLQEYTYWLSGPAIPRMAGTDLLILLFGYSMQIFADFAGYSLIAIGLGLLFGYRLPDNFRFPYLSRTFSEFWRRWHISLSSFLRDYLYVPLGGNRRGRVRTYVNLMITMVLGGLWHGAAWSYAVWGAYHGLALALERWVGVPRESGPLVTWGRRLFVFGVVSFGWLLFKLPDFTDVLAYFRALFSNDFSIQDPERALLVLLYASPVVAYHLAYLYLPSNRRVVCRVLLPVAYGIMLFLIATNAGSSGAFIYFQF